MGVPFYHLRYFLQRRDSLDLIASKQGRIISGTFLSIHFSIFFRETTFLASAFGGLRESHPLSLHLRARFFKKRKKSVLFFFFLSSTGAVACELHTLLLAISGLF